MMARTWMKSMAGPVLVTTTLAALVGCQDEQPMRRISADGSSTSSAVSSVSVAPHSTTAVKPVRTPATDQAAIRALFERERQANENYDIDALVDVSCAQYKDATRTAMMKMVQPMSAMGSAQEAQNLDTVQRVPALLQQKHPKMSIETAKAMVEAWHRQDEAAYQAAQRKMLAELMVVQDWKVENLRVTGDTATADLTSTTAFDEYPPATQTNHIPLLIENGEWKDCFPPQSG